MAKAVIYRHKITLVSGIANKTNRKEKRFITPSTRNVPCACRGEARRIGPIWVMA